MTSTKGPPRVCGVVGWKNSGKTGLVERLVAEITARGVRVSTIKHAHHGVDVDQPGTDSYRHRAAGAQEVLLSSAGRWALMAELRGAPEPGLAELMPRLSEVDLVLVEGFKREGHAKIEAHRRETGQPLLALTDPTIRAVATNDPETVRAAWPRGPVLDLDDTSAIADAVLGEVAA
ncbi:MAG: molybdopterin-guanine dinucleotide biosynthesis protein B [Pseudomonadota bacterium]